MKTLNQTLRCSKFTHTLLNSRTCFMQQLLSIREMCDALLARQSPSSTEKLMSKVD